jgi:hypothetical protein
MERIVQANGVDLCAEGSGDPADPAIRDPRRALLRMEGAGHELPRAVWHQVVPAILRRTAR